MTAADPARTIPVMPSPNIAATRDFYVDFLGFKAGYEDAGYLILTRSGMEIHFWHCDDAKLPELTSCYIRGGEVTALHAEFSARAVPKLSPFAVRPWNMKEFYIHDPHGNLLRFGCAPEEV